MKITTTFLAIFVFISFQGCSFNSNHTALLDQSIDNTLVGSWKGMHYNEQYGFLQKWVTRRDNTGEYETSFKVIKDGQLIQTASEKGKWWVEDNKFHLINSTNMTKPDIYTYKVLSPKKIEFSLISHDETGLVPYDGYTYIATKIDQ